VSQDGGFLPDGRVILRGKNQAHLLSGIGGKRLAFLRLPRAADGPLAVAQGGGSILVTGTAPKSRLWELRMPNLPVAAPTPGPSGRLITTPAPMSATGPLSGRVVGMGALAGLLAIAILGGVLHLRRRSGARPAQRPPG
jgi:hypothetical protein